MVPEGVQQGRVEREAHHGAALAARPRQQKVPLDRRGEALFRDARGRMGKIRTRVSRRPERAEATLSTPDAEKVPDSGGVGMSLYALAVEASTARRRIRRVIRCVLRHPVRVVAIVEVAADLDAGRERDHRRPRPEITWGPSVLERALTAKNSGSVDMLHYVFLPIDRGDIFHPDQWFVSKVIDPIWIWNVVSLSCRGLWFAPSSWSR